MFAQSQTFAGLVTTLVALIQMFFSTIFSLIFLFVAWRLVMTWVRKGDSESERKKGTNQLIAGIIALVVLASLWGIIALMQTIIV